MHETSTTSNWECNISLRVEYDKNNKPLPDTNRKTHSFGEALRNPSDVELIQSLPGVTEDIRSDAYLCTGISSMNKQELLHAVLMYIKSVDDAESLQ